MHLSNGFNGPSITGGWLAYLLATHPDVEEKVIAEIDGITGGNPDHDLQYDDLFELRYTTQVIKEAMRIFPPMPVSIRRSLKDGMLGRYRVRKGDIIFVGTLAAHRDPRYWGAEPDRFDPDQFAIEKVVDRPRHAFIPFSVGKRQCMAQEVTFMMLRVVLYEIYKNFRLRLAPGTTVVKNAIVTTKPASVPIVRLPREDIVRSAAPAGVARPAEARASAARASRAGPLHMSAAAPERSGPPTEIPETSPYRHIVIAYGSNFGANKELAERFAERGHYQGYTSEVITLNELAASPPRTAPWLLVVMTSTYTSNPPSNAASFKTWLERTEPGTPTWQNCSYLVWGLGNTQWNAFLAFPRYVQKKLCRPRRDAARRLRLRRRGLANLGASARGVERPDLAGPARAVRRAPDRGRRRALRRRAGDSGLADEHQLEHRHAALARRGRRFGRQRRAGRHGARSSSMSSVMRRMTSGSRLWSRGPAARRARPAARSRARSSRRRS